MPYATHTSCLVPFMALVLQGGHHQIEYTILGKNMKEYVFNYEKYELCVCLRSEDHDYRIYTVTFGFKSRDGVSLL